VAVLQIWGRANSVNVQKVLWSCEEMGLAYDRRDAGGAYGVVDTPEYRRLNPNGLVPTIVDDGFVLWESNAIVRYLASAHPQAGLWPAEPRARATADAWMDWSNTTLWPRLRPLFIGLVRTPVAQRDAAALDEARAAVASTLAVLDAQLGDNAFVAGNAFSAADIVLGCVAWRWLGLAIARPPLHGVQRWFDALGRRDAFRRIVLHPLN
jgi:glutathione S-transferase